jgi:hypothetical protein
MFRVFAAREKDAGEQAVVQSKRAEAAVEAARKSQARAEVSRAEAFLLNFTKVYRLAGCGTNRLR